MSHLAAHELQKRCRKCVEKGDLWHVRTGHCLKVKHPFGPKPHGKKGKRHGHGD